MLLIIFCYHLDCPASSITFVTVFALFCFSRYGDDASDVTGDAMAAAGNTAQVCKFLLQNAVAPTKRGISKLVFFKEGLLLLSISCYFIKSEKINTFL